MDRDIPILDDKWLKAAVIGSIWAGFEIIIGSMLHNLRIPFTGTFLTFFAIVLLLSFAKIWYQKGILLRAGIICALMKTLSPSAVILGPMIGIITEAIIIEGILLIAGRNLVSYMLAGSITLLSSLSHKVFNLIILYGLDLIEVYSNMISFANSKLVFADFAPARVFYFFVLIYFIIGAAGGIIAYAAGRTSNENKQVIYKLDQGMNGFSPDSKNFNYSLLLLFFHLLFLPLSLLFFENTQNLWFKTTLTTVYLFFHFLYYKKFSGKFLKPIFWFQLFLILLLAGLFLETSDPGQFSLLRALQNGWVMFIRAILIVSVFSAISTELANPSIKKFLIKKGFSKLYLALKLAFSALPIILRNNKNIGILLKNPFRTFSGILLDAENWLLSFQKENEN